MGHPDPAYLGNADLFADEPALQPIVDRMAAGDSGVTRYGLGREAKVIAYAPIEQMGGLLR